MLFRSGIHGLRPYIENSCDGMKSRFGVGLWLRSAGCCWLCFCKKEERYEVGWSWGFVVGVCVDQRRPKRIKSVASGRLESVRSTGVHLMTSLTQRSKEFGDFSF